MTDKNKTKQEFIHTVAVDDGSGNIAYAYYDEAGELHEDYRPSIIEKGAGAGANGLSPNIWECESGNRYTVRTASSEPENTCNREYQTSEVNRVLIANTLADAGLGGKRINIGCTIPTEHFYNKNDPMNPIDYELIERKKASILSPVTSPFGDKDSPIYESVKVYPEAIPGYLYASHDENGMKEEYQSDQKTLVVDLGRFTDDLAIIGPGFEVLDYSTRSHGVHKMIDHFHGLLQRHASELNLSSVKSMSFTDLERIINQGYIGSASEKESAVKARKDVTGLIAESAQYLANLIKQDIDELTENNLDTFDRIVFIGGGAYWLGEIAQRWFHTVDIPAEPEMAIVRGVHLLLQSGN
ncbi:MULTISPECIES: ParM/StbA family protein [Shewanella]|uniref:ParM/StbA family protein n=1 Tax=Shewanella TaxID=22 RepID=UPI001AAEDD61|nr:ParM/StbA family protein [Shewanella algae]MBO2580246.1 ParM/StbA family protein [Shewanella algae]HDS1207833.1 ParM/StbA family protein [Shewanella algae]